MSDSLPTGQPRVHVIDALRGFVLASLMLLHATQHFSYRVFPSYDVPWMATLDQSVRDAYVFLFTDKTFCIFSLLFGFTFYLLYSKAVKQGRDLTWRFAWRMLILLGFGYLHVAFFAGDVLISFAVCGLLLIPIRKFSTRMLLAIAACFLLLPGEWYMAIRSFMDPSYVPYDNGYMACYPLMKENIAQGDWLTTWWSNMTLGVYSASSWKFDNGRIAQICAFFIIGYVTGREKMFDANAKNEQFWTRLLCGSLVLAVIMYPISCAMKELYACDARMLPLKDIACSWYGLCLTAFSLSLFLTLYRCASFQNLTKPLATYGKASLSNYVAQAIIGAIIFYPAGFNLAPYVGMATSSLIALVVIILQILATRYYLKGHKRGPLESLWHRLTWIGCKN